MINVMINDDGDDDDGGGGNDDSYALKYSGRLELFHFPLWIYMVSRTIFSEFSLFCLRQTTMIPSVKQEVIQ